ncbi:MAG: hypothetical protein RL398_1134 [Planctomycetota bacterium]
MRNRIDGLLGAQGARLRGRFALHGACVTALVCFAAVALFFALDHTLRLPTPIRLFHAVVLVALLGFGFWRLVRYPLRRPFERLDVAQVLEQSFPALHQRLVSALQLQDLADEQLRGQSRAMIERLLVDARAAVDALPLDRLFDPTRTRKVALGAVALLTVLGTGALLGPATAKAFALRHLGFAAEYPRETYLTVELPPAGPELQREDRPGETILLLSAGADLHVSVLATGAIPKEVQLDVAPIVGEDDGATLDRRSVAMTPRPGNRFRHVFRRVAGEFRFHARGGDDERGDREVIVRTLRPPQVATIRARIQPPAYAGSEPLLQEGGAVEALIGSKVQLTVDATAAVRAARMVFLESGRELPLTPVTVQDDGGMANSHTVEFVVETSDRYEIRLQAENGLANPNPGNYPIAALVDFAPVGRWLLPDDENLLLLPEASLVVRYEARDDFGLAEERLVVERAGTVTLDAPQNPSDGALQKDRIVTAFFEVKDLLGQAAAAENDGVALKLRIADIRAPSPNLTELPRRIVQVVDAPQLAAAIAKAFRGMREETEQALSIQRDRRARLEEVLVGMPPAQAAQAVTGIEVGQARVAAAAQRVHLGLMRAFDTHLWNKLEPSPNAPRVVELYRRFARDLKQPIAFDPAFYRELMRLRANGTLGALETTLDPLLAMVTLADEVADVEAPAVQKLLARAEVATPAERPALYQEALGKQQGIEARLQQLLLRLEEWNDFQDLIQETRALRDRQRDLQARTNEAKGK